MSMANIFCDIRMNAGVLFVFCWAIIFQVTYAAPAVSVEVGNPLIQSAAAGDTLLKTPEPLNLTSVSAATDGSGPISLAASLNKSVDQIVSDHILPASIPPAITMPNGNISTSQITTLPTTPTTFEATSGLPGTLTTQTTSLASPVDSEPIITSSPATTADLAGPDPMLLFKLLANILRGSEQFMQSMYSPFSGPMAPFSGPMTPFSGPMPPFSRPGPPFSGPMNQFSGPMPPFSAQMSPLPGQVPPFSGQMPQFSGIGSASLPAIRMPSIKAQMPSVPVGLNDPSLKLVDQKVIDEGGLKGQVNTYEGRPDANTISKMQTSQFSVNKDGLQGAGLGHFYSSSSSSSSSGGNPVASGGTIFSSLPRFSMGFPLRLT